MVGKSKKVEAVYEQRWYIGKMGQTVYQERWYTKNMAQFTVRWQGRKVQADGIQRKEIQVGGSKKYGWCK